jgi:hypothetical protein
MLNRLESAVPIGTRVVMLQPGGNDERHGAASWRDANISQIVERLRARQVAVIMLEAAKKHPEGSGKVINALAMAASYDPDPTQFLGIRLPVTFDTCELIEERWAYWMRQDPVVAIETQADNLRRLKALYIDCGEKDQYNLLSGARRFVRRLNELGIPHRYEEFPDNHRGRLSDGRELAFSRAGADRLLVGKM